MDRISETLFYSVKNYLDITWTMSEDEEEKLRGMISRGISFLENKIGKCDFESETQEKSLLMDYCMYARAGQIAEFIQNYTGEIISLQISRWRNKNADQKG